MTGHELASARAHVHVLELEAVAAAALAAAGFPTDLTRAPSPVELASHVDFAGLDASRVAVESEAVRRALTARLDAITAVTGRLLTAGTVADVLALLDDLAAHVSALPELASLQAATLAEVDAVLRTAAREGFDTWLADADRAGHVVTARTPSVAADLVVNAQARRLAAEAIDAAVRAVRGAAYSTARPPAVAGDSARAFVDELAVKARATGTRGLEDVARQAALSAHGAGRTEAIDATEVPVTTRWYASELLDRRTCPPCSFVDGKEYASLEEALADYPSGQFVGCLGGARCRGTLVSIDASETPATRATPGSSATRSQEARDFYRNRWR